MASSDSSSRQTRIVSGFVTFYASGFPMAGILLCDEALTLADAWTAGGLTFVELRNGLFEVARGGAL